MWHRNPQVSLFVPVLLLVGAAGALALTLSLTGVSMRGADRVRAVLHQALEPFNAPQPAYLLAPSSPEPAGALNTTASLAPVSGTEAARGGAANEAELAAFPPGPDASSAPLVVPPAFKLEGIRHQMQTWNNCGPATITMATGYFGRAETQAQAAPLIKPNANDKNVSPDELVTYARTLGLQADWLVGGDLSRLKLLIANGIPVLAEMWHTPHPNDGMGHYRLLVGYDDAAGRFTSYDSLPQNGANVPLPYARFDADWRVFNRTYIPVYPAEKADLVARILGPDQDQRQMWERTLAVAHDEVAAQPGDPFGWFNLGTSFVALGRSAEATTAFDRARTLRLPWRMLWYQFGPFEAYLAEGRLTDVLSLTAANLQRAGDLEESQYYRGRALQEQGHVASARAAYQVALRSNSRYAPAHHALATLG